MNKALLFQNGEQILVSAEDVLNGIYPNDSEFVDAEYPEYKVRFVRSGKHKLGEDVGIPYFRLYYSYDDYKRLFPERADRYQIVANMRRFQESQWHREWKEKVSSFCETEKCFKNNSGHWRFADAFNPTTNTCIELQHSYTSYDFTGRNSFYSELGISMVWLFHLPGAKIRLAADGNYEILEDNAKGFFRAAYETEGDFKNINVFIQVRSGKIYKISKLFRREGSIENLKATKLYFAPEGVWDEAEWIEIIRTNSINQIGEQVTTDSDLALRQSDEQQIEYDEANDVNNNTKTERLQTIGEIWNNDYSMMLVYNSIKDECIFLYHRTATGTLLRNDIGRVLYKYNSGHNARFYPMSRYVEQSSIWKPIYAVTNSGKRVNL